MKISVADLHWNGAENICYCRKARRNINWILLYYEWHLPCVRPATMLSKIAKPPYFHSIRLYLFCRLKCS